MPQRDLRPCPLRTSQIRRYVQTTEGHHFSGPVTSIVTAPTWTLRSDCSRTWWCRSACLRRTATTQGTRRTAERAGADACRRSRSGDLDAGGRRKAHSGTDPLPEVGHEASHTFADRGSTCQSMRVAPSGPKGIDGGSGAATWRRHSPSEVAVSGRFWSGSTVLSVLKEHSPGLPQRRRTGTAHCTLFTPSTGRPPANPLDSIAIGSMSGDLHAPAEWILRDAENHARRAAPGIGVTAELFAAVTASTLLSQAQDAGLVVVGSRGVGGFRGLLVGSVSATLAAHAPCPVIVVRPHRQGTAFPASPRGQIVVGVDGSEISTAAVRFALQEAARRHVGVVAVHTTMARRPPTARPQPSPIRSNSSYSTNRWTTCVYAESLFRPSSCTATQHRH